VSDSEGRPRLRWVYPTSSHSARGAAEQSQKNFKQTYTNLTDLGKQFGLSAVAIGKKLKELGLRQADGTPDPRALEDGTAKFTPLADGTPHYMWNRHKVAELVEYAGLQRLPKNEVQVRELADAWIRTLRQLDESVHGFEDDLAYEEQKDICRSARKAGLTERVNALLTAKHIQTLLGTDPE
jgi:hypothetical protein